MKTANISLDLKSITHIVQFSFELRQKAFMNNSLIYGDPLPFVVIGRGTWRPVAGSMIAP